MNRSSIVRTAGGRNGHFATLCFTLVLLASTVVGTAGPASATTSGALGCTAPAAVSGPSRVGRFAGIAHPQQIDSRATAGCAAGTAGPDAAAAPYGGSPPLLNHGGPVMGTPSAGDQVVVTPIFWEPSGFALTSSYKTKITGYLDDLAADSGRLSNVFASTYQYSGSNGAISDNMSVGTAIDDTQALPADGCTLLPADTTGIYADGSGYSACLDDGQIIAETQSLVSTHSLPSDNGHLYVMFLPQHVESCFFPGSTTTSANSCSLNHEPSAAYCAYHSAATGTVYANMPFPAYHSGTHYSCTDENLGGGVQSPSGDTDADVEISPLSHEMAEAITDPLGDAWYDSTGNENGDDCAYIYGALSGSAGAFYNQTVNGHHYLTQEEFSNKDYVPSVSGCVQGIAAVTPAVTSLSASSGPPAGGTHVTITGTGFPGASSVRFGSTPAPFSLLDATHIDATVPAGAGIVDVTVATSAGTSATTPLDLYTYTGSALIPTVTAIGPASGGTAGGTALTITGTSFAPGSTVTVGGQPATAVVVNSASQITATTPAHAAGTVDVLVTSTGGTSSAGPPDHFTYTAPAPSAPTVTAVSPAAGATAGGTAVTITGTSFTPGSTVTVGGQPATAVVVDSASQITATTPAHAAGNVDVLVTSTGGTSSAGPPDHFTYTAPAPSAPTVTAVSPTTGATAGGTAVTITGTSFTPGSTVAFGSAAGRAVTVISGTEITVTTPKHAKGTVAVTVTTAIGTSAGSAADHFTYLARPKVTRLSRTSGPHSGGTRITIRGSGFAAGAKVRFGTSVGRKVTVVSATMILVTTPKHAKGTVHIQVTTRGGRSTTHAADRYRFR